MTNDPGAPHAASEETIAPAQVPLARRGSETTSTAAPTRAEGLSPAVIAAFALLIVLAIGVFLFLPGAVEERREPPTTAPATGASTQEGGAPAATAAPAAAATSEPAEPAPFESLTAERERRAAQEILEVMLERSERLASMGVEAWAADAAAEAQRLAERGDDAFLAQDYPGALETYQAASDALAALIERGDAIADERIAAGLEALTARDVQAAEADFAQALQIRPGDADAVAGMARTQTLPALVDLLERARDIAADGALTAARGLVSEAIALDGADEAARALARTLDADLALAAFRADMSAGFTALRARRFEEAEAAFDRAAARRPDAPEVAEAGRLLEAERLSARIDALRATALAAEDDEDWAGAADAYEAALELDATLAFALEGRARTRAAANLVASLQDTLEHPERLNAPGALDAARALLERGRVTPGLGSDFEAGLVELDRTLRLAVIPVPVRFTSNGYTDVRLLRVEDLGVFTELDRELRPGSYVATGRRLGFRDVRIEFVVTPDGTEAPVRVACNERI